MRIVIDMQGAQTESRFRGIGRYTLSFAQAVARNRGDNEVVLALSGLFPETIEPIRAAFDNLLPQENIRTWYAPVPVMEMDSENGPRRRVAELVREAFLASLSPDVIHISSLFEGYIDDAVTSIGVFDTRTPVTVSLYDLIPLLNKDDYFSKNSSYEKYYFNKVECLKKASAYLAISEFSKQEAVNSLGFAKEKFINVSTAIEPDFYPIKIDSENESELCKRFGLQKPFILYTGGADQRKNLSRLIQAFASLPNYVRMHYQLLFAGKISEGELGELRSISKKSGLKEEEICFTGYVSDSELLKLYNLCELYVFPSWHEGFGLPALEAMACGAPVIGSNTSSLPEVIGCEEALFNPFDVASISDKMSRALQDEEFRSNLIRNGLQQTKRFSWDKVAQRAIVAWSECTIAQKSCSNLGRDNDKKEKPKLAFVSPLPPERTGISGYSAELLPELSEFYDIEVVVSQGSIEDNWVKQNCPVRDVEWFRSHAVEFDRIVYQFGNSPFHQHMLPLLREARGAVVLHDFYQSSLLSWLEEEDGTNGSWVKELYRAHGYRAVRERYLNAESAKQKYPSNIQVLQYSQGLISHSRFSQELSLQWYRGGFLDTWEVIPLLRSPADTQGKLASRKRLGFNEQDFIVCSFGFLDSTKLNHRLLDAWLNSSLACDRRCFLYFVGENHAGEYGKKLVQKIHENGLDDRIFITGFARNDAYNDYLISADVAVQLRTNSRGETSAAVLDCMNHAIPVVANANGAMKELDADAVWMLPDEFDDTSLLKALETLYREPQTRQSLGARAREVILSEHTPRECARRYADAIERFYQHYATDTPALIRAISAEQDFVPNEAELRKLSVDIASTLPLKRPCKNLFLDVTATCHNDLKTGIERVVRALILALLDSQPNGYRIEPVYLSEVNGEWQYRSACRYTLSLLDCPAVGLDDEIIEPQCGDILLGLDMSGSTLVQAERAGLHKRYREKGTLVYFMVHDLLPIIMQDKFPPGAYEDYLQWLYSISKFDGAVCVSQAVADDLEQWQKDVGLIFKGRKPFNIIWSHHGANISNTSPSLGLPSNADWVMQQIDSRPSFLMVGTIEPRKGYLDVINAFDCLWGKGFDVNLIIVGKEGWKDLSDELRRDIPKTIKILKEHSEIDERLFWLEGVSDEFLDKIYGSCDSLIAASYGEGFGLPLIEAAQHGLSIIARDIPVFREVAGEHAYYFKDGTSQDLANAIETWLKHYHSSTYPRAQDMPWLTWADSAHILKNKLLGSHILIE